MTTEEKQQESVMTPWEVKGKVDYMAQITHFGTNAIDGKLIKRWEEVTKTTAPHFIRRGLVFSHQDLEKILDCVERGTPVYLYTGRGPSSDNMHLGHMVPFKLTRYLQKALNCIVIIQMSDDEKFLFKDGIHPEDLERYRQYSYSNARDIIACGFELNKTLIFSNLESNSGSLYFNNVLLMKTTNMSAIKGTFGLGEVLPESVIGILRDEFAAEEKKPANFQNQTKLDELRGVLKKFAGTSANSVGQCVWPVFQSGPAFCTSFREIFSKAIGNALDTRSDIPEYVRKNLGKIYKELGNQSAEQSIMCLVPMAIDQAPYFRMAREDASILRCPKPAVIHSEFLPGLQQSVGKMSTTGDSSGSTLFLNMTPTDISKTIKRYAFSGGGDTLEEHQKYGGDIRVDICYQYLTFFLEDDEKLKEIAQSYTKGTLSTGDLKEFTAKVVAGEIESHQKALTLVNESLIKEFFNTNRILDIGGCFNRPDTRSSHTKYDNIGIDFDRTFGYSNKKR